MTKIAVLVGSLREGSLNKKFAEALEARLPGGVEFVYADLNLPLYNDDVANAAFPESALAMKKIIDDADGVLLVTPEYNRSISGAMKNALDWASRPFGQNSFDGKKVVIAGVSYGSLGTAAAQSQLRGIMVFLGSIVFGQPEAYVDASRVFDEDGKITEESEEFVDSFVQALVKHLS